MRAAALIVAAGRGARTGLEIPKQFMTLSGKPMLRWSVEAFRSTPLVERILVVTSADAVETAGQLGLGNVEFTVGGATRTASVRAGLAALRKEYPPEAVLIHDAARPGLRPNVVERVLSALDDVDSAAPALPCADALKRADSAGVILGDISRDGLWRVQTPQGFRFGPLCAAYAALPDDAALDDDLAVARAAGLSTRLVAGDAALTKVTYKEDLEIVARMMSQKSPRIGSGFDAHRFGPGDHVTLCGVDIPHDAGLIGHSDADAGWHALTDALLGALGMGDIGDHFPPTDPQWKGAPSILFLRHAAKLVREAGGEIGNVDVTFLCERPKIKPHREAMRAATAQALDVPIERVSVKATTTEEMGFTGRREGLAAQATALIMAPG